MTQKTKQNKTEKLKDFILILKIKLWARDSPEVKVLVHLFTCNRPAMCLHQMCSLEHCQEQERAGSWPAHAPPRARRCPTRPKALPHQGKRAMRRVRAYLPSQPPWKEPSEDGNHVQGQEAGPQICSSSLLTPDLPGTVPTPGLPWPCPGEAWGRVLQPEAPWGHRFCPSTQHPPAHRGPKLKL